VIAPNSAAAEYLSTQGSIPVLVLPTGEKITKPHRDWLMYQLAWRRYLDSWEGGETYRLAMYGLDVQGMPVRNLIRHKREYPRKGEESWSLQSGRPAGTDPANQATDDDYELRRARTPIPTFLADAIKRHLGKIYKEEVERNAPPVLMDWWKDVTGQQEPIDHWMRLTIGPLLLIFGQIDVLIEPPPAPIGEAVETRADELSYGLDRVIAAYILPENLPWWKLNRDKSYKSLVIREVCDDATVQYRYWDVDVWQLYHGDGKPVGEPIEHGYGRVPIVRLFDRKRPRNDHIGMPRYEALVDIQREYYNRDSELILSDTTHAHPLLMGPEDYVQADQAIPIGPNWVLPKKKNASGTTVAYEKFEALVFPHDGADAIRENKMDLAEAADRASMLMKPAGAGGMKKGTVAQSGVSKRLDLSEGQDLLAEISEALQRAEYRIAWLALNQLGKKIDLDKTADVVEIGYPQAFDLASLDEMLDDSIKWQTYLQGVGTLPSVDYELSRRIMRELIPGLRDEQYKKFDDEIQQYIETRASELDAQHEASTALTARLSGGNGTPPAPSSNGGPPPPQAGEPQDPSASESTQIESQVRESIDSSITSQKSQ
jgi:hypothetical protein